MNIKLRPEEPKDHESIIKVNDLSFQRKAEGKLVEELRKLKDFDPNLSIVAESNDEIIGHILFSPVTIETDESVFHSLILAPMSVLPDYQKKSIGKLLVIYGLQAVKDAGHQSVFVLGHPSYYPKFGFKKASLWRIKSPFHVPDEVFLVNELTPGSLDGIEGKVIFPPAFDVI